MRPKMLGSITLGHFLQKVKAIPKNAIFCYLLVQLPERDTSNYVHTLVLLFLF